MIFILACLTMLLDHIGLLFFPGVDLFSWFPGNDELRVIGRVSFPLFAWGIVRGFRVTKNKDKYMKRLFLLGILSQIPFIPLMLAYDIKIINVIFTLLFGLCALSILQTQYNKIFIWSVVLSLALLSEVLHFDYGAYGVLSIVLFHIFWEKKIVIPAFFLLTALFYCVDYSSLSLQYHYQIFATFGVLLLCLPSLHRYDFRLPYLVKYLFYPVHFAILMAIFYWIS